MYGGRQGYEDNYYKDDNNRYGYNYDDKHPKNSHVTNQKIKCINSNINVNGVDITQIPQDNNVLAAANEGTGEGTNAQNGNGIGNNG